MIREAFAATKPAIGPRHHDHAATRMCILASGALCCGSLETTRKAREEDLRKQGECLLVDQTRPAICIYLLK